MSTGWSATYDLGPVAMPSKVLVRDYPPNAFNSLRQVDTYAIRATTLHQATIDLVTLLTKSGATVLRVVARPPLDQALKALVHDIVRQRSIGITRKLVWVPPRDSTFRTYRGFEVYWAQQPRMRVEPLSAYLQRCGATGVHDPRPSTVLSVVDHRDVMRLADLAVNGRPLPRLQIADEAPKDLWRNLWNLNEDHSPELLAVHLGAPSSYPLVKSHVDDTFVVGGEDDIADTWRLRSDKWDWIFKQAQAANFASSSRARERAARRVDAWIKGCIPQWIYAHPRPEMRQRVLYLGPEAPSTLWHDLPVNAARDSYDDAAGSEHLAKTNRFYVIVDSSTGLKLDPLSFNRTDLRWDGTPGPTLYTISRANVAQAKASVIYQLAFDLAFDQVTTMVLNKRSEGGADDVWTDPSKSALRTTVAATLNDTETNWKSDYEKIINDLLTNTHRAIEDFPLNTRSYGPIDSSDSIEKARRAAASIETTPGGTSLTGYVARLVGISPAVLSTGTALAVSVGAAATAVGDASAVGGAVLGSMIGMLFGLPT